MDGIKSKSSRNAPIASLQEAYADVSKAISDECVVFGNWALRIYMYDNKTWNTGSIDIALSENPTAKGIKAMLDSSHYIKLAEEHSASSARIELLKNENGYRIPVNLLYDEDGSRLTHRVPTWMMYKYSQNVGVPDVKIPSRAMLLSYELMAARDARNSNDKESFELHTYNFGRSFSELYDSHMHSFKNELKEMSVSIMEHNGKFKHFYTQFAMLSILRIRTMPLRNEERKEWPAPEEMAEILEEAASLRRLIRD